MSVVLLFSNRVCAIMALSQEVLELVGLIQRAE